MRTLRRGYASLQKATDPYGSRDSSHHIAGGPVAFGAHGGAKWAPSLGGNCLPVDLTLTPHGRPHDSYSNPVGGGVQIHPENARMSGLHGVHYVAQCVACAALTPVVWQ